MDEVPLSKILEKLIKANVRLEHSYVNVVDQYTKFLLLALMHGQIPVSSSILKILQCLTTIQQVQLIKLGYYQGLSSGRLKSCITNFKHEELDQLEQQNWTIMERIGGLLSAVNSHQLPSIRWYMDELNHHFTKKKQLLHPHFPSPSKPWLAPYIQSCPPKTNKRHN